MNVKFTYASYEPLTFKPDDRFTFSFKDVFSPLAKQMANNYVKKFSF